MDRLSVGAGLDLTAVMRAANKSGDEEKCPEKSVILFLCGGTERQKRRRERPRGRVETEGRGRVGVRVNKAMEIASRMILGRREGRGGMKRNQGIRTMSR